MLIRRLPEGLFAQGAACLGSGLGLDVDGAVEHRPHTVAAADRGRGGAIAALQGPQPGKRVSSACAAFIGASPLLYIFLNGSSSNFLGLGLIPEASRARFDLAFWFIAAAPLALFTAIGIAGQSSGSSCAQERPRRFAPADRSATARCLAGCPAGKSPWPRSSLRWSIGFNVGPALGISTGVVGLAEPRGRRPGRVLRPAIAAIAQLGFPDQLRGHPQPAADHLLARHRCRDRQHAGRTDRGCRVQPAGCS